MFRFTIRDVLWLTVVVGFGLALVASRYELNVVRQRASLCQFRMNWLTNELKTKGYRVAWDDETGTMLLYDIIPPLPDAFIVAHQIVTRGVEMAGIGAETDSLAERRRNLCSDLRQLLEVAAQRRPGSRGRLQQHHDRPRHRFQALDVRLGVTTETGSPIIKVVARMRHHGPNPKPLATLEFGDERLDGTGS